MPSAQHHHPFDGAGAFERGLPGRLHLRGHRPDPRLVLLAARREHARVRRDAVPQRRVPRAHRRRGRARRCRSPRATSSTPGTIFSAFGADALRWYFFSAGQPWTPRRVFEDGIRESTRQTLLTLWNVFCFFVTYADLDGWSPGDDDATTAGSRRRARARPVGARRARRHRRRGHRGARATSTPCAAPPASPGSSTTCPTGTSAAAGRASGRPATPGPTPRCTAASSSPPSCWRRSARSSPTSSTSRSRASPRSTWPTGRPSPGRPTPGCRPRWPRPGGWWRSGARPAPTPR